MNNREKAIVTLYTGYTMLSGEGLKHVYALAEELMGRPVQSFEFSTKAETLKKRAYPLFLELCKEDPGE